MTAMRIDGKRIAAECRDKLKNEAARLTAEGTVPGLAVILVGVDAASKVYVKNKKKACGELGIHSEEYLLAESAGEEELLALIRRLNETPAIDGILVQLPLPKHIDEKRVLEAISPKKDVDAFHPVNVGHLVVGNYHVAPCTPSGILELIRSTGQEIAGKECVIIGRSNIVGKPTALLMLHENATVTVCHSKTKNLAEVTRRADILISAVGKAGFVTGDMVKPGAIVIDVGMNRDGEGKLCGDVCTDEVAEVAGFITPVPGGVGPMTIAMLMKNTVLCAQMRHNSTG